jgi:hypothetical protein
MAPEGRASDHLERRVREEADAAARASGLAATMAHLELATAYARRLRDLSRG